MHSDEAFENLITIYQEYFLEKMPDFNEADTRVKIIDRILKECLDWTEDSIKRETHVNAGYIDYELSINGVRKLVIEAKRAGEYFEIPENFNSKSYNLKGSLVTSKNLLEAIEQVQGYCNENGCKYAAVFNSYQIVIFSAATPGKSWREGFCTVFNSIDDIKDNFSLFWNILSKNQVEKGSLIQYIDAGKRGLTFQKLINKLHNPDTSWARNRLYPYLRPISDFIFSDMIDEAKTRVLKECYVYERSNRNLGVDLENYYIDRMPNFAAKYKVKDIYERVNQAGVFQDAFLDTYKDTHGSIIVLLGGIGCGKSTFLHRFFRIILGEQDNLIWFYVDFKKAPLQKEELENYIYQEMVYQWHSQYEEKIGDLLKGRGIDNFKDNNKEFFSTIFKTLQHLGFAVTIVIDNVDQLELEFQEHIFLLSNHLSELFKTLIVLALREESFVTSTRTGVFDAYNVPKFHISSPNFLNMIRMRLDFTKKLLESGYGNFEDDIKLDLIKYISIIRASLERKNEQSKRLVGFIDSISVGNMRDALRMFNNYCVSGNTNIEEIFEVYDKGGDYQIAYHQFIKSIILGEHRYYSQDRSYLMNVFDFDYSFSDSHFNTLRILKYLLERDNTRSPIGRGYVYINELVTVAEDISIRRDAIYDSLRMLCHFGLVELDTQSKTNLMGASYTKITHAGKYYIQQLVSEFAYLDSIIVDTPISDTRSFGALLRHVDELELPNRLDRTEIFVEYLKDFEDREQKDHPEYQDYQFTNELFANRIHKIFNSRKSIIAASAERRIIQKSKRKSQEN